jgi:hypothetical protein
MNQNEAFIDQPPIINGLEIKPLTIQVTETLSAIFPIRDLPDQVWVGAYFLLASMEFRDAIKLLKSEDPQTECMAAMLELSPSDYRELREYVSRVLGRRAAASIEIPESPGKPEESEATQPTK